MAAADYAEGKGEAPPELRLAFRCQQWNSLPVSGGILDQPAGLVERMTTALNVYNAMKSWKQVDQSKVSEFTRNNPDTWDIVQWVLEMRTHGE